MSRFRSESAPMVRLACFVAFLRFVYWSGIACAGFWILKHAIDTFGGE